MTVLKSKKVLILQFSLEDFGGNLWENFGEDFEDKKSLLNDHPEAARPLWPACRSRRPRGRRARPRRTKTASGSCPSSRRPSNMLRNITVQLAEARLTPFGASVTIIADINNKVYVDDHQSHPVCA